MQPTNTLHLGNYLGALKNWVRMQARDALPVLRGGHARDHRRGRLSETRRTSRRATREVTAAYIAAGVDPKRTPIFNQARCPHMPSLPGSSIAWRGSAGSTA